MLVVCHAVVGAFVEISGTYLYSPTICTIGSMLLERTQLIVISNLEHQQRCERFATCHERLTLIKSRIYPYRHIFAHLYSGCTVAASERTTWKNGKKYAAAMSK
jgi:hypothetical protein